MKGRKMTDTPQKNYDHDYLARKHRDEHQRHQMLSARQQASIVKRKYDIATQRTVSALREVFHAHRS